MHHCSTRKACQSRLSSCFNFRLCKGPHESDHTETIHQVNTSIDLCISSCCIFINKNKFCCFHSWDTMHVTNTYVPHKKVILVRKWALQKASNTRILTADTQAPMLLFYSQGNVSINTTLANSWASLTCKTIGLANQSLCKLKLRVENFLKLKAFLNLRSRRKISKEQLFEIYQ